MMKDLLLNLAHRLDVISQAIPIRTPNGTVEISGGAWDNLLAEVVKVSICLRKFAETEETGWISVEERLPETDDHVLCCTRTKKGTTNVVIGYYMDGDWRCGMNSNVTHWMPLPETPEVGQP